MIRNSDSGFTLIELLIVITIIGLLAALAWPLYSQYLQSSRQTAAMAQMRAIGDANELYWTRNQGYAPTLDDLEPNFMRRVPSRDPWGNPYAYVVENGVYRLTSLGSDGNPGPQPPPDWRDEPYEPDIVLEGGVFMQAPGVDAE